MTNDVILELPTDTSDEKHVGCFYDIHWGHFAPERYPENNNNPSVLSRNLLQLQVTVVSAMGEEAILAFKNKPSGKDWWRDYWRKKHSWLVRNCLFWENVIFLITGKN
jgi:hypothetical protein